MSIYLSIVIPTKNRPSDLLVALLSIIPQMEPTDSLIIVDQSDEPFSNPIIEAKKNIYYHYSPFINGLVQAKHHSLSFAKNNVVVFLEDDIELSTNYLTNVRNVFQDQKLIAGCGTEIKSSSSFLYRLLFNLSHLGPFYDPRVSCVCSSETSASFVPSRYLSGGISFFRKEVFDRVKFDLSNNFFALEDIDFSTRVYAAFPNHKMGIYKHICLRHHRSPVNRANAFLIWSRKIREYIVFYKKQKFSLVTLLSFTWLLLCLFTHSFFASLVHFQFDPFRGFLDGFHKGLAHSIR